MESNSANPLAQAPRQRRAKPTWTEGVEIRRFPPKAARLWRRHDPAHEQRQTPLATKVEVRTENRQGFTPLVSSNLTASAITYRQDHRRRLRRRIALPRGSA